jgi:hypothetical protein
VGTAGTTHGELRRTLAARQFTAAWDLPHVPLDALDLTLLAAEKDPDRYEEMARRWLVRWMEEAEPGLSEIVVRIAELAAGKRPG